MTDDNADLELNHEEAELLFQLAPGYVTATLPRHLTRNTLARLQTACTRRGEIDTRCPWCYAPMMDGTIQHDDYCVLNNLRMRVEAAFSDEQATT